MEIQNIIIIAVFMFSAPFGLVVYLFRRVRALNREVKDLQTTSGYERIIEKAEGEYEKIIKDAHSRAQGIVGESIKYIDNMSEAQDEARTAVLREAREDTDKMMQNISEDIKEEVSREIEDFRVTLTEEATKSQAAVRDVIVSENKKIADEIETYKRERIARIEKDVSSTVREVSLEVFGKSLTSHDHKALITKALEKAKAKNVI